MAQFLTSVGNLCSNPFNNFPTSFKKHQLRVLTKRLCEKVPSILPGEKSVILAGNN